MEDDGTAIMHHAPVPPVSARAMMRQLAQVLGPASHGRVGVASLAPLLEHRPAAEPPRIAAATPLEDEQARSIAPADVSGITAFLDGVQRTRLIGHVGLTPIILAVVAAVIRERRDRRMHTWRAPSVERFLVTSRRAFGDEAWATLLARGLRLENADDVSAHDGAPAGEPVVHPLLARAHALDLVATAREHAESALAVEWSQRESRWLWIDGAISGIAEFAADRATGPRNVFGVVKSHATLYGTPSLVEAALALPVLHRSPGLLIRHRLRQPVLSWYLRLHRSADGDPLHGLVRIELPATAPTRDRFTELADAVSSWILLERAPVSLPDTRWDRLAYGVRDCERYLSSIVDA